MQTAVERWQEIIDARAQQMDTAYARLGRTSSDFWDRRARSFHRATKDSAADDPFFLRVRKDVTPQTTVLDVGAGTGRFTLALAPLAQHITAIEPNARMLEYLRQDLGEQGLTNVECLQTIWEAAPDDPSADIVICSHVVYPIRDIVPFLTKLKAAAHRACYLYVRATPIDAPIAHFWRHFHGDELCFSPSYIHVLDVLFEMGIYANVETVTLPPSLRYPSIDVAVEELLERLILPDNEQTRSELRRLVEPWLIEQGGMLAPTEKVVCAIIQITL